MLPFALPEVAVIVAVRLARLEPAENVTVATPEALVVAVGWVRLPLLAVKTIPTPGRPTLPESLTTAEIVTVSPPLPTWTELAITSIAFATVHDEDALDAAASQPPPLPNGGVPALPSPPQPTIKALVKSATTQIKLFMKTSQPV